MTVMAVTSTYEAQPTFVQKKAPTMNDRRKHSGQHYRPATKSSRMKEWAATLMAIVLALGDVRLNRTAQTDPESTGEMPGSQTGVKANTFPEGNLEKLADVFFSAQAPQPPRRSWFRRMLSAVARWFGAWRDAGVAADRLFLAREWCKTISLMAGTATFLYVCWALVDWIPA